MLTRLFFFPYFPPLSILPSLPHPLSCGIQNHPLGDEVGRGQETAKLEINNNKLKKNEEKLKKTSKFYSLLPQAAISVPFLSSPWKPRSDPSAAYNW